MNTVRPHLCWLPIIGGGLLRLSVAWAPIGWLLRNVLSDDAFYYFTIARNVAHGSGLTFDRLAPTNGFHPLWLFLLVPIQGLINEKLLAIHLVLSLSAVIDVLTIYCVWVLLREQGVRHNIRVWLVSLYAFSPIVFSHSGPMNGLETALNLMLISIYLIFYFRLLGRDLMRQREALAFGIVSALLFLVRTDNIVLLLATYVHLSVRYRYRLSRLTHPRTSAITAMVLVTPWLAWSYVNFGSFVQVSGLSIAFVTKTNLTAQGWDIWNYLDQSIRNLAAVVTFFPIHLYNTSVRSVIPALMVTTIGGFVLLTVMLFRSREAEIRRQLLHRGRSFLPLVGVMVFFIVVHTFRAVYLRGWYYSSLLPLLFLMSGVLVEVCVSLLQPPQKGLLRWISFVPALLALIISYESWRRVSAKDIGEIDKYEMVLAMNRILPETTIVGSWNAGVYGYFFDRGTVVNLDGLVNNIAFEYIKNRSLRDYCRYAGVTHLVDPVGSLRFWEPYWQHEPVDLLREGQIVREQPGDTKEKNVVLLHLDDHR